MMRRSFALDSDEEGDLPNNLPLDPTLAFAEKSFKWIPRDNWFRQMCIRIVLNP